MAFRSAALVTLVAGLAAAQPTKDKPGCGDPPGVSRYEGAVTFACKSSAFDTVRFLDRPIAAIGEQPRTDENSKAVSGRATAVAYVAPKGRSSAEVQANYTEALTKAGFETLFACEQDRCGNAGFATTLTKAFGQGVGYELFSNPTDRRYLLARLRRPEGDVYVSVFTSQCKGKPSWGQPPVLIVEVVEEKPMETGKVVVDAEALKGGLEREGKVALYGLFFDSGQAVVKPESKPQLEQMAALLKAQPALELLVVGHTDAEGAYEANVTLSQKRADAVVEALVSGFAVAPGRLKAVGVGMAAPVASNESDAGRARNRRVELVARPKRQR